MQDKLHTLLLFVILALLCYGLFRPKPGRYSMVNAEKDLVLDTQTGMYCFATGNETAPEGMKPKDSIWTAPSCDGSLLKGK